MKKKILWYGIAALDVAIVGFLFVIHILLLIKLPQLEDPIVHSEYLKTGTGLVHFLISKPKVYGFAFVIPTALILAANIVGLVLYLKNSTKREKITANDLTEEEKEALKKELLKELQEK